MVMMTLTPDRGLDRARPAVRYATGTWHRGTTFGAATCGMTKLGNPTAVNATNVPTGAFPQTIKRSARHLGTRST